MRHKILFFCWISMVMIVGMGLIASPLSNSAFIPSLLNHTDDRIFKFEEFMEKPIFLSCTHKISFALAGKPDGYEAKPVIDFHIRIKSISANGVYRLNFTIYCNDQKVLCNIRDEIFEAGSELGSAGKIVPPEWDVKMEGGQIVEYKEWANWNRYLKSGDNMITINTTIISLEGEFQFGEGKVYIEIGPMKVEVRSLDVDRDGITDPIDSLGINNYALLPMFGIACLPISAGLEYMIRKASKKL